jgi:peptidoglycan/xylan/chitin deacetylase (PgdA/CDA1 family)
VPPVRVLNYHGVVDRSRNGSHFAFLFSDLRDFAAQVSLLARRAAPVSLDELEAAIVGRQPLPDRAVHVTFDDGYRNNIEAAEVLDKHRVPWSLFAVVDAVLEGYRPWYLRLADAIDATSNVMVPSGAVIDIGGADQKVAFARRLKSQIMAAADQDAAVDRILSWKGVRIPDEPGWSMLDIADLKELSGAGVAIGNHSARHRNLGHCTSDELTAEVSHARQRLENSLGTPVRHFAYPDGRHDRRVREAVGLDHGLGFATWTVHRCDDRLAVRRYEPVDVGDLDRILTRAEPWYGARWLRWNAYPRTRELSFGRSQ